MERGSYLASRYDPGRERAYHLSILLAQGLSAWAVPEVADGAPLALGWGKDGDSLNDGELPTRPLTVSFITLPEWSTLVPDGALAPGSEARHLALVHGGLPSGAMRDEPVEHVGATCIYVHDDRLEQAALERFPHARPLPMQALMVRTALARCGDRPVVLLHRSTDRLDCAVAKGGRLLLSNTFPARSWQDVLYYALLATERCGSQPDAVDLLMSGTHLSMAERELLQRYFTHAAPAVEPPWSDPAADKAAPADRWLAVLDQFACAS